MSKPFMLLRSLKDFSRNCFFIWKQLPVPLKPRSKDIFMTYLSLCLSHIILEIVLKHKIEHTRVFNYEVNFYSLIHYIHLFEESYIRNEYYFESKIQKPVIFDCGGNIDTTLYFKWLYPEAIITTFEADPITFKLLKRNIDNNNLTHITVFNNAVYDSNKILNFYSNPNEPGSGLNSLYKSVYKNRSRISTPRLISAKKLSPFITSRVDLLKLDIEGAEDVVLAELNKAKKLGLISKIITEYHHHHSKKSDNLSRFLGVLETNKFSYLLSTALKAPFEAGTFQDIIIYSYKN